MVMSAGKDRLTAEKCKLFFDIQSIQVEKAAFSAPI
jgi:hypothetical protein